MRGCRKTQCDPRAPHFELSSYGFNRDLPIIFNTLARWPPFSVPGCPAGTALMSYWEGQHGSTDKQPRTEPPEVVARFRDEAVALPALGTLDVARTSQEEPLLDARLCLQPQAQRRSSHSSSTRTRMHSDLCAHATHSPHCRLRNGDNLTRTVEVLGSTHGTASQRGHTRAHTRTHQRVPASPTRRRHTLQ